MKNVSVILSFLLVVNLQCTNKEEDSSTEFSQTSSVVESEKQLNNNNAEPLQLTDIYYIIPGNVDDDLKLEENTGFWDENAGVAIGVSVLAVGALALILHSSRGTSKAGAKAPHVEPIRAPSSGSHVEPIRAPSPSSHVVPAPHLVLQL